MTVVDELLLAFCTCVTCIRDKCFILWLIFVCCCVQILSDAAVCNNSAGASVTEASVCYQRPSVLSCVRVLKVRQFGGILSYVVDDVRLPVPDSRDCDVVVTTDKCLRDDDDAMNYEMLQQSIVVVVDGDFVVVDSCTIAAAAAAE